MRRLSDRLHPVNWTVQSLDYGRLDVTVWISLAQFDVLWQWPDDNQPGKVKISERIPASRPS